MIPSQHNHNFGEIITFQDSLTAFGGYPTDGEVEIFQNNTWNDTYIEPMPLNYATREFSALAIDNFLIIFGES